MEKIDEDPKWHLDSQNGPKITKGEIDALLLLMTEAAKKLQSLWEDALIEKVDGSCLSSILKAQ